MDTARLTSAVELLREADYFLKEAVTGPAERSKRALPSTSDLQIFLLFVRAKGEVPKHQVKGPIAVQTLLGHAEMSGEGTTYDLPKGSLISFVAGAPHAVRAFEDSVLLVTHAIPQKEGK